MTIVFKIPRVGPRAPWAQGPALIRDREGGLGGPIPPGRTGPARTADRNSRRVSCKTSLEVKKFVRVSYKTVFCHRGCS